MDAVYIAVVGSACSCVLEVGSDREGRSSDVCYIGDTRETFSANKENEKMHKKVFKMKNSKKVR